ncbi:DUF4178 domain-containing protein [Burkholderia contaminans]
MRCRVPDDEETWDEYLLLNPTRGFLWLVQSEGRWERVQVLDQWPTIGSDADVTDGDKTYRLREEYESEVVYVVGAFNWRVQVGDRTSIIDYGWQKDKLTRERSDAEIVWSRARPLSGSTLAERFGTPALATAAAAAATGATASTGLFGRKGPHSFAPLPLVFSALLVILNMGALFSFSGRSVYVLVGLLVLWLPEWLWKTFASDGGNA